ncbi:MAG: hypothetical protein ACRDNH_15075 [Gaiellaceae bacterium]
MRRFAVIASLLACSLLVSAVALAGEPRLEQKRLRPADMALARATTLRASDLSRGWVRRPAQKPRNELPTCPGVDMDFSMFTITGTASSRFEQQRATIDSHVEVFESQSDAARDFRKATTAPVLRCVGRWLRQELTREVPGARVVSSKLVARPRVGQQAIHYRIVLEIQAGGGTVRVYVDLIAFQRGRTGVSLTFGNVGSPLRGELAVARSIVARAR